MRRAASLAAALALLLQAAAAAEPLPIKTYPIRNFAIATTERQFGALEFLGGIELVARNRRFGGISGLEVTQSGARALLVSDNGYLVSGELRHEGGLLTGFDRAEISRVFADHDAAKHENDVEDVAFDPADPTRGALVLERQDQALMSFRWSGAGLAEFETLEVPAQGSILRSNRGLESVAFAPPSSPAAGHVVVIAEGSRETEGGRIPGWIIGSGRFEIVKRDAFDISSARFLPGGDLLLLERRYSPGWGVGMRLRRIAGDLVRPGAELDGEVLLEAGLLNQIDNMEGLSVHSDAQGRTILTLVSDDNKNFLQRTILLQFALAAD